MFWLKGLDMSKQSYLKDFPRNPTNSSWVHSSAASAHRITRFVATSNYNIFRNDPSSAWLHFETYPIPFGKWSIAVFWSHGPKYQSCKNFYLCLYAVEEVHTLDAIAKVVIAQSHGVSQRCGTQEKAWEQAPRRRTIPNVSRKPFGKVSL